MTEAARKTEQSSHAGCCCSTKGASHAESGAPDRSLRDRPGQAGHDHGNHAPQDKTRQEVRDPVCGMTVDPHRTPHRHQHEGHPYYFCSKGCLTKFAAEPAKYLGDQPTTAESVPEGMIYTCPMHPEIRQVGPGACPICGMALEPMFATADTGPNEELIDMTRRSGSALCWRCRSLRWRWADI